MDYAVRQLACAVVLQAARDFARGTEEQRQQIIQDLRSPWMQDFTSNTSCVVASQLENHPQEIIARLLKQEMEEEENEKSVI